MNPRSAGEQPVSQRLTALLLMSGAASGALAILGVALPGPLCRFGLLGFDLAVRIIRYAAFCGVLAMVFSLAGLILAVLGRHARYMAGLAAGLVLGILAAGIPYAWLSNIAHLPAIHDISTDTATPPAFEAGVLAARHGSANSATYGGSEVAALQAQAYPDIRPLVLAQAWTIVYPAALRTVQALGWKLDSNDPMTGIIEATSTSRWFGISYDVVIRIRGSGTTTRLDIRSESRQGHSDAGYDAHLIRVFRTALYKQLGMHTTERH
ncbi:MAG: DUF1499 domain-containing protein [Gammaproteobacteria bacterium]|nr:DUF1499 domain-containing protein [Gammaproteobacteria bacterium]MDE2346688.1 DUF1499 domain-containing protein [Gammaproteobacteria bacterium]